MERKALDSGRDGLYFRPEPDLQFFSTGCAVLDETLGGSGYPLGRVVNVVGDKSTGKTLLFIEAAANFELAFPKGLIRYKEVESAFDRPYAFHLGMPKKTRFDPEDDPPEQTVEEMAADIKRFIALTEKKGLPGLYGLDSIDALTDEGEMSRELGEATYGGDKPKLLGQFFRREVRALEASKVCFFMISQVRDNIGAMFGEKHKRSGGKSLDFYSSQVLWLHHKGEITKTKKGVKRTVGVKILAKCKKNKVGAPFRSCEFPIIFGFGIDDVTANLEWLESVKRLDEVDMNSASMKRFLDRERNRLSEPEYASMRNKIAKVTHRVWREIEDNFAPKRRKYGS